MIPDTDQHVCYQMLDHPLSYSHCEKVQLRNWLRSQRVQFWRIVTLAASISPFLHMHRWWSSRAIPMVNNGAFVH